MGSNELSLCAASPAHPRAMLCLRIREMCVLKLDSDNVDKDVCSSSAEQHRGATPRHPTHPAPRSVISAAPGSRSSRRSWRAYT